MQQSFLNLFPHKVIIGQSNALRCKNLRSLAQTLPHFRYPCDRRLWLFMYVFTLYFYNVTFCNNYGYIVI